MKTNKLLNMRDLCERYTHTLPADVAGVKPVCYGDFMGLSEAANTAYAPAIEDPVVIYDTHYDVKDLKSFTQDRALKKVVYADADDQSGKDKTALIIQFAETDDLAERHEKLMFRSVDDAQSAKRILHDAIVSNRLQRWQATVDTGFYL